MSLTGYFKPLFLSLFLLPFMLGAQGHDREMEITIIKPQSAINCTSEPVSIGIRIDNWISGTTYEWENGFTDSIIQVKPKESTNFNVTVRNVDIDFERSYSIPVEVVNQPIIGLPSQQVLSNEQCLGDEITLAANHAGGHAPFSYEWPTGNNSRINTLAVFEEQSFFVTVTDACGSKTQSRVDVSIQARNPITSNGDIVEYFSCEGDELQLSGSLNGVSGGVGFGYQYTFSDWSESNEPKHLVAEDGMTIPVKISDACQSDFTSVNITLKKSPIEIPSVEDIIVCKNDTTNVVQNVPDQVYYWNGNGYTLKEEMPVTDDMDITLTYIDRCSDQHAVNRKLIAEELTADFDFDVTQSENQVQLEGKTSDEDLEFEWFIDGISASNSQSPSLELSSGDVKQITLKVTNKNGCSSTITREVSNNRSIWIPTIFSPNNDGRNDAYSIVLEERLEQFSFEIFDRWGQLIYKTNDQDFTWMGNKSSSLPIDTYAYVMLGSTKDGKEIKRTGTITIINN